MKSLKIYQLGKHANLVTVPKLDHQRYLNLGTVPKLDHQRYLNLGTNMIAWH